jgi:hypothetical protein
MPLKTMLTAKWVRGKIFQGVFGFSKSDEIPENMA